MARPRAPPHAKKRAPGGVPSDQGRTSSRTRSGVVDDPLAGAADRPAIRWSPRLAGSRLPDNNEELMDIIQSENAGGRSGALRPADLAAAINEEAATSHPQVPTGAARAVPAAAAAAPAPAPAAAAAANPDNSTIAGTAIRSTAVPADLQVILATYMCKFMRTHKLLFTGEDDAAVTAEEFMMKNGSFQTLIQSMEYDPRHYSQYGHLGIECSRVTGLPLYCYNGKNMGATFKDPFRGISTDVFTKPSVSDQVAVLCPFCTDGYKFKISRACLVFVNGCPDSDDSGTGRHRVLTDAELCSGMRFFNHPRWIGFGDEGNKRFTLSGETISKGGAKGVKLQNPYLSVMTHFVALHAEDQQARELAIFRRFEDECAKNLRNSVNRGLPKEG